MYTARACRDDRFPYSHGSATSTRCGGNHTGLVDDEPRAFFRGRSDGGGASPRRHRRGLRSGRRERGRFALRIAEARDGQRRLLRRHEVAQVRSRLAQLRLVRLARGSLPIECHVLEARRVHGAPQLESLRRAFFREYGTVGIPTTEGETVRLQLG